jgi:peptide deformylase
MLLPLAYYNHPVLRQKVQPVETIDDSIRQLVVDMTETMHHHKGIGLAAPQVHHSLAIMLVCIPKYDEDENPLPSPTSVFINPKLIEVSSKTWTHSEGCLSIPGLYEGVERPVALVAEVTTMEGKTEQIELNGWEARAFLHENDHLNGVLFFDRVRGKKRAEMENELKRIKKKYSDKNIRNRSS